MSTLQTYINQLPPVFRGRYLSSGLFVTWLNQLLEELQERKFLSSTVKETGTVVSNKYWIDKPSDFILLDKIWDASNPANELRVTDVNNRFKLLNTYYTMDTTSWLPAEFYTGYANASISVVLGTASKTIYPNYVMSLFNCTGHGFTTGMPIAFGTTGTLPSGISASTLYYAIRVDDNNFKAALSLAAAQAGTPVTFSDNGAPAIYAKAVNVYAENELENYLLWITGGTLINSGIVVTSNDASVGPRTKIYFNQLESTLTTTKITSSSLIPDTGYVMLRYHSIITAIESVADEIPIENDCEARLVPIWLRWCCERETMSTSNETIYWQGEKDRILHSLEAARSYSGNRSRGRRLVGFEPTYDLQKKHPPYSEFL